MSKSADDRVDRVENVAHAADATDANVRPRSDAGHAPDVSCRVPSSEGSPLMRKFAVLGMAVALAAGLSACSSSSKPASDTTRPPTTTAPASAAGSAATRPSRPQPPTSSRSKADTLSVVTSLPGPGFWEGSDSDPTKLTSGYEYDIAKCMQSMFGLLEVQRAQRELRRDRRRHGHELRPRALAGVDHARAGEGRRRSRRRTSSRSRACSCESDKSITHARRGQDHEVGRADGDDRRSTC